MYFRRDGALIAVDAVDAEAMAATNPTCVMAVEIRARLAAHSPEPVDLNLPGYASNARAALAAMSPDAPAVASLREALA